MKKDFQTIQGLYAIGSGGIFGRGFGNSLQKLGFVPEAQNDMIFSIICEEMGAAGAIFLIFSVCNASVAAGCGCHACKRSGRSSYLLRDYGASGSSGYFEYCSGDQYNPNTGITLPFISYGGTSAVFLLGEMGLAMNVGKCDRIN